MGGYIMGHTRTLDYGSCPLEGGIEAVPCWYGRPEPSNPRPETPKSKPKTLNPEL